jgi:putative methyltransferase (TIGR04325 family)
MKICLNVTAFSWPLLAGLMWAANISDSTLRVVDFGGALGSTYFQNRRFFKHLVDLKWCVVEQEHFVEIGQRELSSTCLGFFRHIDEAKKVADANILVCSSSLQYLEKPYEMIQDIIKHEFEFIFLDRTAIVDGTKDRLTLQIVPDFIYKASYPCWFFAELNLVTPFLENYELIESFTAFVGDRTKIDGVSIAGDKGFLFKRKRK